MTALLSDQQRLAILNPPGDQHALEPQPPSEITRTDGVTRVVAAACLANTVQKEPPQPPRDVLSVDECARWLRVNRKTVYDAVAQGVLPCGRLGRRVLLARSAIEAWLAGKPHEAPPAHVFGTRVHPRRNGQVSRIARREIPRSRPHRA